MEKIASLSLQQPQEEAVGSITTTCSSSVNLTNGYDYELLGGDSRYECPICLCYLRDPVITTCGHRFCIGCISQWMIKEGGVCPVCGNGQRLEMENIFPDNYTRREIMQLKAKCPNDGCLKILSVSDLEQHIKNDHTAHGTSVAKQNGSPSTSNGLVECVYKEVGCITYFSRDQLNKHLEADVNHHLQLLTAAYRRLKVVFSSRPSLDYPSPQEMFLRQDSRESGNSTRWLLADETLDSTSDDYQFRRQRSWDSVRFNRKYHSRLRFPERLAESDESLTYKGSGSDSQHHHGHGHPRVSSCQESSSAQNGDMNQMKDLFERVVRLEQGDREKQIKIDRLESQLSSAVNLFSTVTRLMDNLIGRVCNGVFVWKIHGVKQTCIEMRQNPNHVLHSMGFYSSTFGYKMCLRFNLTTPSSAGAVGGAPVDLASLERDEEAFVSLYIHIMQGEFDDTLRWPFQGEMKLMIVHPKSEESVIEVMSSKPEAAAFARPNLPRNPKGYGFNEFCPVNKLFSGGFIDKNDTLAFKIVVKARSTAE